MEISFHNLITLNLKDEVWVNQKVDETRLKTFSVSKTMSTNDMISTFSKNLNKESNKESGIRNQLKELR